MACGPRHRSPCALSSSSAPTKGPSPPARERRQGHSLAAAVTFTIALLGAIALALRGTSPVIALSTVLAVITLVGLFHFAFFESDFFSVIFANSVGVYACIYMMFVLSNFPQAHPISVQIGFVLPLLAFGAGVMGHRRQIQLMIRPQRHVTVPFRGALRWLGPLLIIAVVTTYLKVGRWTTNTQDAALIVSMAAIGGVAWLMSRSIALFLMECGIIFRSFLRNIARLARPAFALLTCYFLITIIFACVYTIYDQYSGTSHFLSNGVASPLTFPDGLYLSISTLTTVGFGDIIAITPLARLIVSSEVLCGILLLFGVDAMLDRTRPD